MLCFLQVYFKESKTAFDQSDENLDSIIIFDFSNIEEPDDSSGKRKRATSEQLEKLISFTKIHPDFIKGSNKEDADQDIGWQNLTAELNAMGPPIRTCRVWRTAYITANIKEIKREAQNG